MRRREEGLGFWLGYSAPAQSDGKLGIAATIRSWLRPPAFAATVDLSPDVMIEANLRTESFTKAPAVIDGLQFLGQRSTERGMPAAEMDLEAAAAGQDVVPDRLPNVNAVDLWTETDRTARTRKLIPMPPIKFRSLWKAGSEPRTCSAALLDNLSASADASAWFVPMSLAVRAATPRFLRLPHSRKSVDLDGLGIQETEKLVHEAETVRGIEHGQGELLAIFLHVPVEVVSRMRFLEEAKQLLYTLIPKPDLTRTRVHEMLAVRDRRTGDTHLVPHRTRYCMAFFA